MPSAPRTNKKAEKIAFNIIGKPENLKSKKNANNKKIDKILFNQKTRRIR